MTMIPLNLGEVKERQPVPAGKYDVTVQEVDTEAKTKEGKPQWVLSLSIGGHELTSPNLRHYVGIPSERDNEEQRNFKMLNIARLNALFGLPQTGLDSDALLGATANAEITLSEPDDQGRVFNRLVLPFLKQAGAAAPKLAAARPPKR